MATTKETPITLIAIDDDASNLELISSALASENLEIITHVDPEDGLKAVLRKHPDIVLVDLMMPKMTGMDVLEKIADADPGIEVILMTANYSTESAVEAIHKG